MNRRDYGLTQHIHELMKAEGFNWIDYKVINPTEYGLAYWPGQFEITIGECNLLRDNSLGLRV